MKITTILGNKIDVPDWLLSKKSVEAEIEKQCKKKLVCIPGVLLNPQPLLAWKCFDPVDGKVYAYWLFSNGFRRYPEDFEYGISGFIPFSSNITEYFTMRIIYVHDHIRIQFN